MQSVKPTTTPTSSSKRTCSSYTAAYFSAANGLNKRFYKSLLLFSVVFSILFQARFSISYTSILNLFSWTTVIFTALLFITGLIVAFVRNISFTVFEPVYPSYLAQFIKVWTSLDNALLFGVHAFLSLVIIRFYFSWIANEKYTNEFLLQPPGHYLGARQLNQENIFITVYSIILAFNYTFQYLSKRSFVVKINNVQQPLHYELKTSFATLLCNSAMRAIYSFKNSYIAFIIFNGSIYYYVARFFGFYHKVLDSPIMGFRWIDLHLFLRLIVAGTLTTCTFNAANRLFDAIYSTTLNVTDGYDNQFECLVQGLSDAKPSAKVAAFSELATLSCKYPEKRASLFRTIGKDLTENAWYKIMVQCFNVLNELRRNIDIEYNGVQPVTAPAPVVKPAEPKEIRNRVKYSTEDVFAKHTKVCSDLDDRTGTIFSEVSDHLDCVHSAVPDVDVYTKKTWTLFNQSYIVKLIKEIEIQVGSIGSLQSIYAKTVTRRIQSVFNKYQLTVWAIQSLGSLTAASLKEDPYGYVQNDISNVLNQLLGCLVDVEKYLQSPPNQYKEFYNEGQLVQEAEAVLMALREAIYQIRLSFDDYLESFAIDRKYYNKWQKFVNNQE